MTMSKPVHLQASPVPASDPANGHEGRRAAVVRRTDTPPTLGEANKRLAATRGQLLPWLSPDGLEAAQGLPEVLGPETYRKP